MIHDEHGQINHNSQKDNKDQKPMKAYFHTGVNPDSNFKLVDDHFKGNLKGKGKDLKLVIYEWKQNN